MIATSRRSRLTAQMAERRRRHRALGLCLCGRPRRDGGKTCVVCYARVRQKMPLSLVQKQEVARQPATYVRLSFASSHEQIAEISAFCDRYAMTLEAFILEAAEAYMETTAEAERREDEACRAEAADADYARWVANG